MSHIQVPRIAPAFFERLPNSPSRANPVGRNPSMEFRPANSTGPRSCMLSASIASWMFTIPDTWSTWLSKAGNWRISPVFFWWGRMDVSLPCKKLQKKWVSTCQKLKPQPFRTTHPYIMDGIMFMLSAFTSQICDAAPTSSVCQRTDDTNCHLAPPPGRVKFFAFKHLTLLHPFLTGSPKMAGAVCAVDAGGVSG